MVVEINRGNYSILKGEVVFFRHVDIHTSNKLVAGNEYPTMCFPQIYKMQPHPALALERQNNALKHSLLLGLILVNYIYAGRLHGKFLHDLSILPRLLVIFVLIIFFNKH